MAGPLCGKCWREQTTQGRCVGCQKRVEHCACRPAPPRLCSHVKPDTRPRRLIARSWVNWWIAAGWKRLEGAPEEAHAVLLVWEGEGGPLTPADVKLDKPPGTP